MKFNRRDFLKISAIAAGGLLGASIVDNDQTTPTVNREGKDEGISEYHLKNLDREQLTKLREIASVRKKFNLSPIPDYLREGSIEAAKKVDWDTASTNTITNNIGANHESIGMNAIRIGHVLYGINAPRLIKAIIPDPEMRSGGSFDHNSRQLALDFEDPNSEWFKFATVHEYGHGNEPSSEKPLYPVSILVDVSHGIWKCIDQANQIDNMFLNDINSYNVLQIMKGIGEGIGFAFRNRGNLEGQSDLQGQEAMVYAIRDVANESNIPLSQMKFTKKVCAEIGKKCFDLIVAKKLNIQGELLKDYYLPKVEGAFTEIYADMFSFGILSPERLNHNPELLSGVQNIISAVSPQTDNQLIDLKSQIEDTPQVIKDQYTAEQKAIDDVSTSQSTQPTHQDEIAQEINQNDIFTKFYQNGVFPESFNSLPEDQKAIMQKYASVLSTVYTKYPSVIYGLTPDDMSFDPNLNIWDTNDIAEAYNTDVIWNLLADPRIISENLDDIQRRISILDNFIQSPDFGSQSTFSPSFEKRTGADTELAMANSKQKSKHFSDLA